ncbi:MAG TPA: mandelate racemase/muconate lactonizing enzyme family protein [Burkholderiales bacterium]
MKIIRWSLHFYSLPYSREIVWVNAVERAGTFALLLLEADNGARGVATGTLKATWSGVSPRSLKAAMEDFIMPRLNDVDVVDPDIDMVRLALAGIPENRLAKGMVETACWGLRAMAQDQPLWRHLGGDAQVDLAWALTPQAPLAMAQEAAEMRAAHGFTTMKVRAGQGTEVDMAALREVRAAVGPEVALYVDANSAYPSTEALSYVRALNRAGVVAAEDPCPLLPDQGFESLQLEGGLPILIDRNCTSVEDAKRFLERGATAFSVKSGRIGLTEARLIAQLAGRRGAKVAMGLYGECELGALLALQLAAAIPPAHRLLPAEVSFYLLMTEQVIGKPLQLQAGRVTLPETADLAALIDWESVKRHALP